MKFIKNIFILNLFLLQTFYFFTSINEKEAEKALLKEKALLIEEINALRKKRILLSLRLPVKSRNNNTPSKNKRHGIRNSEEKNAMQLTAASSKSRLTQEQVDNKNKQLLEADQEYLELTKQQAEKEKEKKREQQNEKKLAEEMRKKREQAKTVVSVLQNYLEKEPSIRQSIFDTERKERKKFIEMITNTKQKLTTSNNKTNNSNSNNQAAQSQESANNYSPFTEYNPLVKK